MPGGDGTGPLGFGARTGWGRGLCRGFQRQGWVRSGAVGGGGRGGGWSWRHRFWARGAPEWTDETTTVPPFESEKRWLEQRCDALGAELEQISTRLADLERDRAD